MSRYRNNDNFKNLNNDEFVEAIMEQYQPFEPKYLYNGITLREYCIQNDLSYYSVVSFVKRKLAKGSKKSIDELIDEGINTINRYGIIYYYNGIPLKDYCEENNLNANSIRGAILRKQAKTNQSLQEIINNCVESYQKFTIKYYYNGEKLLSYCNKIGLNYNTVIQVYLDKYSSNPEISIDDAIKQIVDYYIENPPVKTKYYFNDLSLSKFCDANGYPYLAIYRRIRTLQNKKELNDEQIIETAIKKYEDKLQINKINEIFKKLENLKVQDYNELKDICEFLKIDFENVFDLVNMNFSYNQAINLIWYFSDKKSNSDFKIITDKKLKILFSLVDDLKVAKESDIENFELYDLIGIYKSGLYDSRKEILIRQKKYILNTIYSLCKNYNIKINRDNFNDFESEIKLYLITVINRTNLNIYGQIVKYMDLTTKGYFRTYLKQYQKQNNKLSLDDAKYSKDKGTRNAKTMIDFIADPNNSFENLDNVSFSSSMMKVLSNLEKEDLLFIMLKFQENYTDIELAEHFKLTIDEVKDKEFKILSLLKDNPSIQILKKTK